MYESTSTSSHVSAASAKELETIREVEFQGRKYKLPRSIEVTHSNLYEILLEVVKQWQVDYIKLNYYESVRSEL